MKSDGTVFTLENEELLITIERHGAQLSRIYDKKADREILWNAETSADALQERTLGTDKISTTTL